MKLVFPDGITSFSIGKTTVLMHDGKNLRTFTERILETSGSDHKETAEAIVRAVNNHDDLVLTLEKTISLLREKCTAENLNLRFCLDEGWRLIRRAGAS